MLNRKYFNLFQLLVAGASEVGKTSLIHRFTDDYFTLNNINGIDFKLKIIKIKEKRIKLQIWDMMGCVSLRNYSHICYKGNEKNINCIIFLYDITNEISFKMIKECIEKIEDIKTINAYKILVGNKCDSLDRVITEEEGKELADNHKMDFIEVSAKSDKNITELFYHIANEIFKIKVKNQTKGEKYKFQIQNCAINIFNNLCNMFYFNLLLLIIILIILLKLL